MLENKNYYFYIITGVYPTSLAKLELSPYNVACDKLHSRVFKKVLKHLSNSDSMLDELIAETQKSWSRITFVLYSNSKEDLIKLFYFLIMLQPSKLSLMASFDTNFDSYELEGKQIQKHVITGLGLYDHSVAHFKISYAEDTSKRLFTLVKNEVQRANKLLEIYMTTKHPESFKKFMGIYYEAHEEEKSYVKYLLFMMFIESLVVDDEQTGVTYKLARMCAVLVGDNAESSLDIFKKMKKSYTVRSQLVHSAKNQIDTGNYLMFIHSIVCELIITIILNRLETKDLFSQATVMGFGERSAIWKDRNYKNMYNFWMNEINFILDLKETSK